MKGIGPPVTFANPVITPKNAGGTAAADSSTSASGGNNSAAESLANEGLSDSTFDALTQSPMHRHNTLAGTSSGSNLASQNSARKTKSPKQTLMSQQ